MVEFQTDEYKLSENSDLKRRRKFIKKRGDTVVPLKINRIPKEHESAENTENETISALLNTSSNILFVVDEDHNLLACNDKYPDLLEEFGCHLPVQDLKNLAEILNSDSRSYINIGSSVIEGQVLEIAEGVSIPIRIKVKNIPWGNQNASLIEIIDLRNEIEINELKEQLRKYEFTFDAISRLSHDFNNIVSVIVGHGCLVESMRTAFQEDLAPIIEASNRAGNLSYLLGKTAAARCFETDINKAPVNIVDLIQNTIKSYNHWEKLYGIKFRLSYDEKENLIANIDENKIWQVLQNLIVNSQEAMKKNSSNRITISINNMPKDTFSDLPWQLEFENDCICICVEDNGEGIQKKDLNSIFIDKFSTKYDGKGRGLAIVKELIEKHGGKITVESETGPKAYTRFFIFLPKN